MSSIKIVGIDHPLSRAFNHKDGLLVGDIHVPNVEMGRWYIGLIQDGQRNLAEEMYLNQHLRRNPMKIQGWLLNKRGYEPSASVYCHSEKIYTEILLDQLQMSSSPIKDAFDDVMVDLLNDNLDPTEVTFAACIAKDYVWSCGLRESVVRDRFGSCVSLNIQQASFSALDASQASFSAFGDGLDLDLFPGPSQIQPTFEENLPGVNLYGKILNNVFKMYLAEDYVMTWGLHRLISEEVFHMDDVHNRTVLILADSMLTQMITVDGGVVDANRGATFKYLADKAQRLYNPFDFRYIVVCAGVNDVQKGKDIRDRSWLKMENYIRGIIASGFEPGHILVSLPTPRKDIPEIVEYSFWIAAKLEPMGILSINWCDRALNPFQYINGEGYERAFDTDYFHLCHAGIREILREWYKLIPDFEPLAFGFISYANVKKLRFQGIL